VKSGFETLLTAIVSPSNASNRTVIWTSSNTAVATVSAGIVTGHDYGMAVIRATTSNGIYAECVVTIYAYDAVVNHFFDDGYRLRYSLTQGGSAQEISNRRLMVNNRFMALLLLNIDETAAPMEYTNCVVTACKVNPIAGDSRPYLDRTCKGYSDADLSSYPDLAFSGHIAGNGALCNHVYGLAYDMYQYAGGEKDEMTTNVIWSGHRIFSYNAAGSLEFNRCYSFGAWNVIAMVQIPNPNDYRTGILFHELCHQFCSIKLDHYCELDANGDCKNAERCSNAQHNITAADRRPNSCVMSTANRTGVSAPDLRCDACKADIMAHLNDHH